MKELVIGLPKEYFPASLDPEIRRLCDAAVDRLRALGATVREVSLPHTDLAIPVYYIVAPAEASSNLARFDGVRYGFRLEGDGLRGMYEATRSQGFGPRSRGASCSAPTCSAPATTTPTTARRSRCARSSPTTSAASFDSGVDVLFTPTAPSPAFPIGAISDPYEMYLSDIFTATANLAGVPAMSLPIGRIGGLPVGGQFLASHFDEARMFTAAYALERALGAEAHA